MRPWTRTSTGTRTLAGVGLLMCGTRAIANRAKRQRASYGAPSLMRETREHARLHPEVRIAARPRDPCTCFL